MSRRPIGIAGAILLAGLAAADAAPNIPPSELPGRERQRFQDSPIDRFTQPDRFGTPLWHWDDRTTTKSRKKARGKAKRR